MNDSNQNISRDVSDDAVRRFLLGQLSANEQPGFEHRLFLDSELEARVRLAEFDLADDYACSRLGAEDRERFEQRFLASNERKLKLNVSNAKRRRREFLVNSGPGGRCKTLHSRRFIPKRRFRPSHWGNTSHPSFIWILI